MGAKRTVGQREADLERITRWYCEGRTLAYMADQVSVSYQQVQKDIKEIQRRWQESSTLRLDTYKAEQLAKIDTVEAEAWSMLRKSQQQQERTLTEQIEKGEGRDVQKEKKARLEKISTHGDPRLLAIIDNCIDRRCKILGLYAPEKIAPTNPDGSKPFELAVKQMTDEELRGVASLRRFISGQAPVGEN